MDKVAKSKPPIESRNATITSFFKPVPRSSSQVSASHLTSSPTREKNDEEQRQTTPSKALSATMPIRPGTPKILNGGSPAKATAFPLTITLKCSTPPQNAFPDSLSFTADIPNISPKSVQGTSNGTNTNNMLPLGAAITTAKQLPLVIMNSDNEDDGSSTSDDDLPDYSRRIVMPARVPPPNSRGDVGDPTKTPRAKRMSIANMFKNQASPLSKTHSSRKIDHKVLLATARQLDRTNELYEALAKEEEAVRRKTETLATRRSLRSLSLSSQESMSVAMQSLPETLGESERRGRVLQAMRRAGASARNSDWSFFSPDIEHFKKPSSPPRFDFPSQAATGHWKFLAVKKHRRQFFEDGKPSMAVLMLGEDLPVDIFNWVLRETLFEKSKLLRDEYLKLIEQRSKRDLASRINEDWLQHLFLCAGASEEVVKQQRVKISARPAIDKPRSERDWSNLRHVLSTLMALSSALNARPHQHLAYPVGVLLRLGMDRQIRVNLGIREVLAKTLAHLVDVVDTQEWDIFCAEVCQFFYDTVKESSLRWDAVSAIPAAYIRTADLRRRLALMSVLDDGSRFHLRSPTSSCISIVDFINRLGDPVFAVNHKADFYELMALVSLLAVGIDDGCPPPAGDDHMSERKQFDDDVDQLAKVIEAKMSGIHDRGDASRLKVRLQFGDFERILKYRIRSCPPLETLFGLDDDAEWKEFVDPRQQTIMANYFMKIDAGR